MALSSISISDLAPALRVLLGRTRKVRRTLVLRATGQGSISLTHGDRTAEVQASGDWTGAITLSPPAIMTLRDSCRYSPQDTLVIDGRNLRIGSTTIQEADLSPLPAEPDGTKLFPYSPATLLKAALAGDAERLKEAGLAPALHRAEEQCSAAISAAVRCLAPLKVPASIVKAAVDKAIREHAGSAPPQPPWMEYVVKAESRLSKLGLQPGFLRTAVEEFMRAPWADPRL